MNIVDILPDSNNKAYTYRQGNRTYLQSYETVVASYDHETESFTRHWDGYSMTTGRHLSTFFGMYSDWEGGKGVKAKFNSLPFEELD